jgi:hypothetical protein
MKPEPQLARRAARDRDAVLVQRIDVVDDPSSLAQDACTGVGRDDASRRTPEQRDAEPILEIVDALAEGGLLYPEPASRLAEAATVRCGSRARLGSARAVVGGDKPPKAAAFPAPAFPVLRFLLLPICFQIREGPPPPPRREAVNH